VIFLSAWLINVMAIHCVFILHLDIGNQLICSDGHLSYYHDDIKETHIEKGGNIGKGGSFVKKLKPS